MKTIVCVNVGHVQLFSLLAVINVEETCVFGNGVYVCTLPYLIVGGGGGEN
jgi:hypothetical protein